MQSQALNFIPFSPVHGAAVVICSTIIAGVCIWGKRNDCRASFIWLVCIAVVQSINVAYFAFLTPFDWAVALPFQLCDLMGWVGGLALLTRRPWLRTASVYIGLCLCSQAFITPTVTSGPDTLRFWLFFATHTQIIGSGIYEIVVRGYQPTWKNAAIAMLIMIGYGAVFIPVNIMMGWNYGYIGPTQPQSPTMIDSLGPWPTRLIYMFFIVAGAFGTLTLISMIVSRLVKGSTCKPTATV